MLVHWPITKNNNRTLKKKKNISKPLRSADGMDSNQNALWSGPLSMVTVPKTSHIYFIVNYHNKLQHKLQMTRLF